VTGSGPDATVIAVLTYERNDGLRLAIPALLREAATIVPPATVLVIDNNPDGRAVAVVAPLASQGVRYVHEPAPGIAAARNRALREAGCRFLVFIDDDMHPSDGWLAALLATQRETGAALVAGPVISEYDAEPEDWVLAGRFFIRRRLPTGTALQVAATNNMLLDLNQINDFEMSFDDRFGLIGGSDHLFTRTLARRGAVMVWCDEAITIDRVPVSRLTRSWVLRRAFRLGNSESLVRLALCRTRGQRIEARMRATTAGTVRIVGGGLRWAFGLVTGSLVHRARGQRAVHRGAGMVSGAYGHAYAEYARPSGAPAPGGASPEG
jgi:succinoglycan biosynthesis protein ExoM